MNPLRAASLHVRAKAVATLLIAAVLIGCDERSKSNKPVAAADVTAPAPVKVEHPGNITGRVVFSGKPPVLPRLQVVGDGHCDKLHPDGLPDESVVVAANGALANVFVYLENAPRADGAGREPALMDQIGCQYVPHAVGVQINQPMRIKSSDPVLHNVHVQSMENPPINLAEVQPGEQTVKFGLPEIMRTRCDVHPWMKGVIGVFANSYFAVTGFDGKFAIKDVPQGKYKLIAWHERFGEISRNVAMAQDGFVEIEFTYGP